MKAFLMAAGLGTRLRPITNTIPKCMVSIKGQPLLGWWMDLFEKHDVSDVLINTHYLPEPVRDFICSYNRQGHKVKIHESYEPVLLGSAGTLRANKRFVESEGSFLICYADNLTNANLSQLVLRHEQVKPVLTMGLFHMITEFIEKPKHPASNLANAGIYVAGQEIFDYIPCNKDEVDMGKDVLPLLTEKMAGFEIKDYLLDVGTMSNYQKAQEEWQG